MSPLARRYVLAVACGAISEGLLIFVLTQAPRSAAPLATLLLVEAAILGFVFGAWPGAVGSALVILVLGIYDAITCDDCREYFGGVVFACLLLGGMAWLVGTLRERYGRPRW
jgi:hypothetical protein